MNSLIDIQNAYLTNAYQFIIPEMVLVGAACVLFIAALFKPQRGMAVGLGLLGIAGAILAAALMHSHELSLFAGPVAGSGDYIAGPFAPFDPTGWAGFTRWLCLGCGVGLLLISWPELRREMACEYAACLLVLIAGTSLVGRANDLISLFLALELISIPTYVLLYLPRRSLATQEAAAKYFLLSILASAFMLFGFSYLYGLTGSTNLSAVIAALSDAHKVQVGPMSLLAILMTIAGLGFRITAVPFHFYAPDVYESGPTSVVTQLAIIPKIAGFVALIRVLGLAVPGDAIPFDATRTLVPFTLWVLAAITMTLGNIMALLQGNIKRLIAYSGIAHGGYMLIGLVAGPFGTAPILFYLVAYALMTIGLFAVLLNLAAPGGDAEPETIDDLSGLGQSHPISAGLLTLFLLSFLGFPLTAGFFGKFLLFQSGFLPPTDGSMGSLVRILVVIAAINAAIGAVYYLKAIGVMYMRSPLRPTMTVRCWPALVVALVCAVGTLVLGCYPDLLQLVLVPTP